MRPDDWLAAVEADVPVAAIAAANLGPVCCRNRDASFPRGTVEPTKRVALVRDHRDVTPAGTEADQGKECGGEPAQGGGTRRPRGGLAHRRLALWAAKVAIERGRAREACTAASLITWHSFRATGCGLGLARDRGIQRGAGIARRGAIDSRGSCVDRRWLRGAACSPQEHEEHRSGQYLGRRT